MRGAALSDLHLGFRAFAATVDGRNAREVDVERALSRAAAAIVEAQPDLVTIAGDVFHHPRVGSHAVKALRDFLLEVVRRTAAQIVIIQGNHDAGRTAEVLSPVVIPDDLDRVHVVTTPKRIRVRAASTDELVAIVCLPFTVLEEERTYRLRPDPEADVNVMVIHAPVNTTAEGAQRLPSFYAGEESLDVGRLAEEFDVVAAGDYHEFHRFHPERLAFYSGSLERTSSNIWQEKSPKGMVLYDTATGEMRFREVPTRPMVDDSFRQITEGVEEPTAENVNNMLRFLLELGGAPDSISRLKVDDVPRSEKDGIDWSLVRQLKQTCLHFQLDITYTASEHAAGDRRDRRGRSLLDEAQDYFAEDEEPVRELVLAQLGGEA